MKHTYACILALVVLMAPLCAQSSLDLRSRALLHRHQALQNAATRTDAPMRKMLSAAAAEGLSPRDTITAMIKLSDGASVADLEAEGVVVLGDRCGMVFAYVDANDAARIASLPFVARMELDNRRETKMNCVRELIGVDKIHNGIDLPRAYTGAGVITGIVDGGFDPNHVNFRKADGTSRIGMFSKVEVNTGSVTGSGSSIKITTYSRDQIPSVVTDDNTQYHGTHTLGIMSGSYRGDAVVAVPISEAVSENQTQACPYYGIAYDADIAASAGSSYDALIAYGIENILEYRYNESVRQRKNVPLVVNLSLGGNQGSHDGRGMLSQYIDTVAALENVIFCLSAGNEGDLPIALNKTFTADHKTLQTFIRPYVYTDLRYGFIEVYSNDTTPFDIQAVVYNRARGTIALRMPATNTDGTIQYYCSSSSYVQSDDDIIKATFAKAYEGYVGVVSMLDTDVNRFYAAIDYYAVNSDENEDDNYLLGFVVTGREGQRIDCFGDGSFDAFDGYEEAGWDNGMCNGSISDMATGHHIVSVGSYNSRNVYPALDGGMYSFQDYLPMGEITLFSSYGTLIDGREQPLVVAPGATVLSSMSTPYARNASNGVTLSHLSANAAIDDRDNYYVQMFGTSMASPVVAGSIALWLEANPNLTPSQVQEIIRTTAVKDEAYTLLTDPVQGGAGKFDAYAGLKEAIRSTRLDEVRSDKPRLLLYAAGDHAFNVFLQGANALDITICDLAGRTVLHTHAAGDEAVVDASTLGTGVYVVRVNDANPEKIVVNF